MIKIIVSNGVPYIWNPEDWKKLRTEYRILGRFDGALNHSQSSHTSQALPLRLSNLETQLLIKLGVAQTVEVPKLYNNLRIVSVEDYFKRINEHKIEQVALMKERKRMELEALVDKIIEGKQRKGRTMLPDRNAVINDELQKISLETLRFETIKIDIEDPWANSDDDYAPYDFPPPSSEAEILKFRVFEDFNYNHKYYLTAGTLFGGDFLAYPGDPVEYHAEFIIVCQTNQETLADLSLISQLRLAKTVKKSLLLASISEKTGELLYKQVVGPHARRDQEFPIIA